MWVVIPRVSKDINLLAVEQSRALRDVIDVGRRAHDRVSTNQSMCVSKTRGLTLALILLTANKHSCIA